MNGLRGDHLSGKKKKTSSSQVPLRDNGGRQVTRKKKKKKIRRRDPVVHAAYRMGVLRSRSRARKRRGSERRSKWDENPERRGVRRTRDARKSENVQGRRPRRDTRTMRGGRHPQKKKCPRTGTVFPKREPKTAPQSPTGGKKKGWGGERQSLRGGDDVGNRSEDSLRRTSKRCFGITPRRVNALQGSLHPPKGRNEKIR